METAVDESYEVDQIDMRFLKVMISIHGYPLNSTRQGELAGATGYQAGWRNAKSELGGRNNKMRLKMIEAKMISEDFNLPCFGGRIFFGGKQKSSQYCLGEDDPFHTLLDILTLPLDD